jgi:hypothetical protein
MSILDLGFEIRKIRIFNIYCFAANKPSGVRKPEGFSFITLQTYFANFPKAGSFVFTHNQTAYHLQR